jgi:hypothetical protein
MKVEANLTVIKGQANSNPSPRRALREGTPSGVVLLISQENQEARRLDPASLAEAQSLLQEMSRRLTGAPGETLAEVHRLKPSCLVRLP